MAFTARRFQRNMRFEAAAKDSPPFKRGESGEAIEILQQALIDLGFAMPKSTAKSVIPDGIYGSETEATVRTFQTGHGLVGDGVAGRNTLALLDRLFTSREALERNKILAEANTNPPFSPWYVT